MKAVARGAGLLVLSLACSRVAVAQWWSLEQSGLDTNLRGVSAVMPRPAGDDVVVWASGSNGVILRSSDRGKKWQRLHVAGGSALDFRGIVGFDEKRAYVMSSGDGENSRIYKTTDGGETWTLQYSDKRKAFFLDALLCVSEKECYALADPIDGKFLLLSTKDGEHWAPIPSERMPAALTGEGSLRQAALRLRLPGKAKCFSGRVVRRRGYSTRKTLARLGRSWRLLSPAETPLRAFFQSKRGLGTRLSP